MLPPWWVYASAAVPLLGLAVGLYRWVMGDEKARLIREGKNTLRGARARSIFASFVFTAAVAVGGLVVWLLASEAPRVVVFVVLWVLVALYFVIAAGAFKTQLSRFMPAQQGFRVVAKETILNVIEAFLWGPITVLMLLKRQKRDEKTEELDE